MLFNSATSSLAGGIPRDQTPEAMAARSGRGRFNWLRIVESLCLVLLTCACYLPAINGTFLWDDDVLLTKNPLVLASDGLKQIWFSTAAYDYYPVSYSWFWLEWRVWGNNPLGYHLVGLALHIGCAFLLWRLLRMLRLPGAWFGALLYAIHPINVASVAWIAECKNVLSMAFYLGCLICWVHSEEMSKVEGSRKRYFWALGLYVLALLSKSSVVMLPCVLLLLAWWRQGKISRRDLIRTGPFFVVSLADGLVAIWFQYHRTATPESLLHADPPLVRLLNVGRAICFYLGKIFWPRSLAMLYPHWEMSTSNAGNCLWPVAVGVMLASVWWGRKLWGRGPATALGYFVLTLLPVSGLLHMTFFVQSNVSDHLVHVSALGMFALVSALLGSWYARGGNTGRCVLVLMTGITGLLCLGCFLRADDFNSSARLWQSTLEVNPRSFAAYNNLGTLYLTRGNLGLAEAHFREALRIEPRTESAAINLADVLRMKGHWSESAALYRQILGARPNAQIYDYYGVTLLELGENAAAREAFQHALALSPSLEDACYNLYGVELADRHLPAAYAQLRACLRINPDSVRALTALLALNLEQTDLPPLSLPAAETMVALAEHACRLTQFHGAQQLALWSKALLAAGRRDEAISAAAQARAATTADEPPELVDAIERYRRSLQP